MKLPEFENYSGPNALRFDLGNALTVWFSYKTPVAYSFNACTPVVKHNDWNRTTAKHLYAIDGGDKSTRVTGEHFERLLAEVVKNCEVTL